jgi:hypothetical protein
MSPLVTLGWRTDPAWVGSSSPRPPSQAHTAKHHVSRANPHRRMEWPQRRKHAGDATGSSAGHQSRLHPL